VVYARIRYQCDSSRERKTGSFDARGVRPGVGFGFLSVVVLLVCKELVRSPISEPDITTGARYLVYEATHNAALAYTK
jgi:hypothetical protein